MARVQASASRDPEHYRALFKALNGLKREEAEEAEQRRKAGREEVVELIEKLLVVIDFDETLNFTSLVKQFKTILDLMGLSQDVRELLEVCQSVRWP